MLIGISKSLNCVASDSLALPNNVNEVIYMEEGDTFAMPTFFYSLWYLAALFGFMLIDVFFQL